jgi:hypothetical protein
MAVEIPNRRRMVAPVPSLSRRHDRDVDFQGFQGRSSRNRPNTQAGPPTIIASRLDVLYIIIEIVDKDARLRFEISRSGFFSGSWC